VAEVNDIVDSRVDDLKQVVETDENGKPLKKSQNLKLLDRE
jgi:hypothetical protein